MKYSLLVILISFLSTFTLYNCDKILASTTVINAVESKSENRDANEPPPPPPPPPPLPPLIALLNGILFGE